MTVREALDSQIIHRILLLEERIDILAADGAPEAALIRLRRKLKRARCLLADKAKYERIFPGLLDEDVLSLSEIPSPYKALQFKTETATYTFMTVSGSLTRTEDITGRPLLCVKGKRF